MLDSGDRFRVKERGHQGTIIRMMCLYDGSGNCVNGSYGVLWDSFPDKICYYDIFDVKDLWEKITDNKNLMNSVSGEDPGNGYVNQDPDVLPAGRISIRLDGKEVAFAPKPECDHKWVEVGFTFSKIVCKHCDKEKVE